MNIFMPVIMADLVPPKGEEEIIHPIHTDFNPDRMPTTVCCEPGISFENTYRKTGKKINSNIMMNHLF